MKHILLAESDKEMLAITNENFWQKTFKKTFQNFLYEISVDMGQENLTTYCSLAR